MTGKSEGLAKVHHASAHTRISQGSHAGRRSPPKQTSLASHVPGMYLQLAALIWIANIPTRQTL